MRTPRVLVTLSVLSIGSLGCFCGGLFDPSVRLADQAAEQRAAGELAEAVIVYEELLAGYPDAKGAAQAAQDLESTRAALAESQFAAGEFEAAGRTIARLAEPTAVSAQAALATDLVAALDGGNSEAAVSQLVALAGGDGPEGLKSLATKEACARVLHTAAHDACIAPDPDVTELPRVEALARLGASEAGCELVASLGEGCGAELSAALAATREGGAHAQLAQNVDAKVKAWRQASRDATEAVQRVAAGHGDTCAAAVRSNEQLERRYGPAIMAGGYQGRQASVDFLVAQRPNHDQISTSRESLSELKKAVEAEDWPSEHRKQSLDAIEQAEGKCR